MIPAEKILEDSIIDIQNNGWFCDSLWDRHEKKACAVGLLIIHGGVFNPRTQRTPKYPSRLGDKHTVEIAKAMRALAQAVPDYIVEERGTEYPALEDMKEALDCEDQSIVDIEKGVVIYNDGFLFAGRSKTPSPRHAQKWFEDALAILRGERD
jgi:hypothetical protein